MTSRPAGRCAIAWRPVVLAVLLAACGGSPASAPSPAAPADPPPRRAVDIEYEQRLDAMFANLPEPSAERAFTFDAEIEYGVPERGSFRLEVTVGEHEGRPAWYVVQHESHPAFPNGMAAGSERREIWLSRDLRVLAARLTIAAAGQADVVRDAPMQTRALPLAAALIYFRACPAEVTAPPDPVAYPVVASVDDDGTMHCVSDTADMSRAFITLRGADRVPVEVKRFLGWHNMGTIVAPDPPK